MSTGDPQVLPGQDERFMAAISHALVIATGVGMVGGAVIWILQRQKSSYVAFQTLQAVTFQFVGVMLMWAGYACWGCLYGVSMVPLLTNPEAYGDSPPAFFWISLLLVGVPLALMGVWMIYGVYGAVRCLQGKSFRYLWVGGLVERYLEGN